MVTTGVVNDLSEIKGIGHRVVQGGDYFDDAVEFNADVEQRILDLVPLAPLHNPANLACYREFKRRFQMLVKSLFLIRLCFVICQMMRDIIL